MSAAPAERTPPRILVACIGNIFWGDDGFGVAVADRLAGRRFPPGVEVADFGIRGIDLAYTLLDGCDTLVLVDAAPRGSAPGTLYLLEPQWPMEDAAPAAAGKVAAPDAHSMDPMKVLAFAHALGARPRRTLVVGCEPSPADEEMRMGLSEPVRAATNEAVKMIEALIEDLVATDAT